MCCSCAGLALKFNMQRWQQPDDDDIFFFPHSSSPSSFSCPFHSFVRFKHVAFFQLQCCCVHRDNTQTVKCNQIRDLNFKAIVKFPWQRQKVPLYWPFPLNFRLAEQLGWRKKNFSEMKFKEKPAFAYLSVPFELSMVLSINLFRKIEEKKKRKLMWRLVQNEMANSLIWHWAPLRLNGVNGRSTPIGQLLMGSVHPLDFFRVLWQRCETPAHSACIIRQLFIYFYSRHIVWK